MNRRKGGGGSSDIGCIGPGGEGWVDWTDDLKARLSFLGNKKMNLK